MIDPVVGTSIVAGLTVWGSKDMLNKLLGPSADYFGQEACNLVKKCNVNISAIFEKAKNKIGNKIDEPGVVNPRVLKTVIDEGKFCDNEITAEYLGGLLASSRTPNGRDDRGLSLLAIVKSLSVYQLRFHYAVYHILKGLFDGKEIDLNNAKERRKMSVAIPWDVYVSFMDFTEDENPKVLLPHVVGGLHRNNLIALCTQNTLESNKGDKMPGIVTEPTVLGTELFMWLYGYSDVLPKEFLNKKNVMKNDLDIKIELSKCGSAIF